MKPQDVLFLLILIIFIVKKNVRITTWAGIISLFITMPLFSKWIFFTAQRLTWYAGAFFFLATMLVLIEFKNENRD